MTYKSALHWIVTGIFVWFWYMFCTNPNLHIDWNDNHTMGMTGAQSGVLGYLITGTVLWLWAIACRISDWDGWDEPIFTRKKK